MATDSHGMGIELPADSTPVHQFPGVTRLAMERVAEILAGDLPGGVVDSINAQVGPAVDAELAEAGVFKGTRPSPDDAVALSFTDKDGRRFWIEAGYNGRPTAHALNVLTEDLTPRIAPAVGPELGISELADFYGWAWVVTDAANHVLGGFKTDGTWTAGKMAYPADSINLAALAAEVRSSITAGGNAPVTLPIAGGVLATVKTAGGWQLRKENTATGASTLLATAGTIKELSTSSDGATVFFTATDADGSNARTMYVPAAGGTAERVIPYAGLAAFGDSMTHGMGGGYGEFAWPAVCAKTLNWPYYNGGLSAQMSTEIAIRQGGVSPAFTVAGNSIPAAGAVALTITDPTTQYRNAWEWTWTGTLAGVPGVLKKDAADVWTFTRDAAGAAVAAPAGTRFVSTPGLEYDDWVQTFWTGRNNVNLAVVTRDTASMVAHLKPWQKRYLVFSVCNTSSETAGTTGYNNVKAINDQLAATYGARYLDVRAWLIASGLAAAGIAPTAQDTTDIANDVIPTSLRADSTHLNAAGYDALGKYVASIITTKGWA